MENSNDELKYLRDDFFKVFKDYFDYEKEYYDYMSQFFSHYLNGVLQQAATKGMNAKEWEIITKMRQELENRREALRGAEDRLHEFYNK